MNDHPVDYFVDLAAKLPELSAPAACELLDRAAREHPRDPRPLAVLGAILLPTGRVDAAEAAYLTALQRAPDFAVARFQLGFLHLTSNRPAAAMATWAPLEALGETNPFCLFSRALGCLAISRPAEARRWLLAGMAANTTDAALNREMHALFERIPADGAQPGSGDAEGTEHAPPARDDGAAHFLVSTYERKA